MKKSEQTRAEHLRAHIQETVDALHEGFCNDHSVSTDIDLKIQTFQILGEIAAQLATMAELMEKKNALLEESVALTRTSVTHAYEHDTEILKMFTPVFISDEPSAK